MVYIKSVLEMQETHRGKVVTVSKGEVKTRDDLSTAYSPGVSEPCRRIAACPGDVYRYTCKGNMVAVVSNGTAGLGPGDIGPPTAPPVMGGEAGVFTQGCGGGGLPPGFRSGADEENAPARRDGGVQPPHHEREGVRREGPGPDGGLPTHDE